MKKTFRYIALLAAQVCTLSLAVAQPAASASGTADADTIARHKFQIHALARAFGDSIVIRWAPEEYVPWKYLNGYGYTITRVQKGVEFREDTLATDIHPLPRREFMSRFAETDSMAAIAVELIFNKGTGLDQTQSAPGSAGSVMEVYDEQQNMFGFAMLAAELRPDLAEAMGLRFVDRTAVRGARYDYLIKPQVPDSILPVWDGLVMDVVNEPADATPYHTEIADSIVPPKGIILTWPKDRFAVFHIERRDNEQGEWRRINEHPYVPMEVTSEDVIGEQPNKYLDDNLEPGVYEYRLRAVDPFGQLTAPTQAHRVELKEMVPPSPPILHQIILERTDTMTTARLIWHKDTLEDDFVGYLPMYYNANLLYGQWLPLRNHMLAPTDTACTVNVTGLQTGSIAIVAYDSNGNVSASLPQTLRISDITPPQIPLNLRGASLPSGEVTLLWSPSPDEDVMEYEIWKANALNHDFIRISDRGLRDTIFHDTISVDANQRYIYYCIKATDYSGNASALSAPIGVPVPNFEPPTPCRPDSVYSDDQVIRITWIGSAEADVKWHRVYRRLEGEQRWTLLAVVDADQLTNHKFTVEDRPPYDQKRRYYYAVETLDVLGCSSGLSFQKSFLFQGPRILDIPVKLMGEYVRDRDEARLTWDIGSIPEDCSDYYYVIYRKSEADDDFRFLLSRPKDDVVFADRSLGKGQQAQYYVFIQFDDGRRSHHSDIVTIKHK